MPCHRSMVSSRLAHLGASAELGALWSDSVFWASSIFQWSKWLGVWMTWNIRKYQHRSRLSKKCPRPSPSPIVELTCAGRKGSAGDFSSLRLTRHQQNKQNIIVRFYPQNASSISQWTSAPPRVSGTGWFDLLLMSRANGFGNYPPVQRLLMGFSNAQDPAKTAAQRFSCCTVRSPKQSPASVSLALGHHHMCQRRNGQNSLLHAFSTQALDPSLWIESSFHDWKTKHPNCSRSIWLLSSRPCGWNMVKRCKCDHKGTLQTRPAPSPWAVLTWVHCDALQHLLHQLKFPPREQTDCSFQLDTAAVDFQKVLDLHNPTHTEMYAVPQPEPM